MKPFARRFAEYMPNFEVYLQFDSLELDPLMRLRGADLRNTRRRAIDRLNELEISTTLVVTLQRGLNDGEITFYKQGNFTDLCRGPHIPSTGYIKAIKVLSVAGAYWKGDSNNKQLTRVYGITFPNQKLLDAHMAMLEEAKKRDHRTIGKELEIFTFDDEVGPGLPLWLPKGGALIEKLEALAKHNENEQGYVRVKSPHMVCIYDGGNISSQNLDVVECFNEYAAMKPNLGWMHIKDYLQTKNGHHQPGHVDEDALKHFVPADIGDCGHVAILRDFADAIPKLEKRLKRRGIPGVFLDLEPHVKGGGQFGGFSGPDGMGIALAGLRRVLDFVGIDYHLRDFDDIRALRGF